MTAKGGGGDGQAATPAAAAPEASDDARLLGSLGYAQELRRRMSGFSNFAISFSIICILAGGITSLQLGISAVGGAAAGLVWPAGVAFSLVVALAMAQIASAFPTAGGLYHWGSILGGRGWGWVTAWLNLGGLIFLAAAVNFGAYTLFADFLAPMLGVDRTQLTTVHQIAGVALITVSQALVNHLGIRLTSRLTDFSGYLILVVTLLLVGGMLARAPHLDVGRPFQLTNNGGAAGGQVWPQARGLPVMFLLALLWPVYTITGFDASAHTSEETLRAAHNVPRGILRSVLVSGGVGWLMVASFVLAMPDLREGARQGGNVFPWLMSQIFPGLSGKLLWIGIVAANYLCGLASITSTSRMIYAFARDGGLPFSSRLRRVAPRWGTPVAAIWTTAVLALASTLWTPAYATLTTACASLLYLSYVMPVGAGFFAIGRTWTRMGPFDLGRTAYRALAAIATVAVLLILWIGVQPPNQRTLTVIAATLALLAACWWLGVRKTFRGPPNLRA
ncbi:MAG TPA: amino acid permease [Polyangia bacterium]|nr:amino acid permease [Polyangia bacterium]